MDNTKGDLAPEFLDALWHRVMEIGESRDEAAKKVREGFLDRKKEEDGE